MFLLRLVSTQAWARVVTERETRDRCAESRRKRRWAGRFDYSVGLLIDAVRKDRETDLESTRVMTKMLLHWLHLGEENDRDSEAEINVSFRFKAWTTIERSSSLFCVRIWTIFSTVRGSTVGWLHPGGRGKKFGVARWDRCRCFANRW